MLVLKRYCRAL